MRRLGVAQQHKTERAQPGERDRDRKLTKRGRNDASLIGAYMTHHGLEPDLALVSPATRAQESWALLADCFAKTPKTVSEERVYNADPQRLMDLLAETEGAASVVLVGHNPGLHDLAVELIASGDVEARERVGEGLPTSGLVVIDLAFDDWSHLHPHSGRLERFVSPRLIGAETE